MVALTPATPPPAEAPAPEIPETTILVLDDVHGTQWQFSLPETPDEALANCVILYRVNEWLGWHPDQTGPIEVSLRKTETTIVLQFVPTGDVAAAREALELILAGEWRETV